jgi:hypothetical protein
VNRWHFESPPPPADAGAAHRQQLGHPPLTHPVHSTTGTSAAACAAAQRADHMADFIALKADPTTTLVGPAADRSHGPAPQHRAQWPLAFASGPSIISNPALLDAPCRPGPTATTSAGTAAGANTCSRPFAPSPRAPTPVQAQGDLAAAAAHTRPPLRWRSCACGAGTVPSSGATTAQQPPAAHSPPPPQSPTSRLPR